MKYVASPYTSPHYNIRAKRYEEVTDFVAYLIRKGIHAYSPIIYWHNISLLHGMPYNAVFWERVNFEMLSKSSGVYVLAIDGWKQSVGIAAELKEAKRLLLPITYFKPTNNGGYRELILDKEDA